MPLHIIRNNLVNMDCDAIVNTANPLPRIGAGTDSAVYAAAGEKRLLEARQKIGEIAPGCAAVTHGYALKARYIIHTVGPVWRGGEDNEETILRSCYRTSLRIAEAKRCKSVAFPLISAGSYGYPKEKALETAVEEIRSYLAHSNMIVYLVVFGQEAYELSGKYQDEVQSFIDEHYVKAWFEMEYGGISPGRRRNESTALYEDISEEPTDACYSASVPDAAKAPEMPAASQRASARVPKATAPSPGRKMTAGFPATMHRKKKTLEDSDIILAETFSEKLLRFIDEKEMTDVEVYKRANIDRKLFSKIRSRRDYQPKKKTALALAIALRLDLDQTKDLLSRAGYAISPSSKFDLIVEFFIVNEVYDIDTINIALFDHKEQTLG